MSITLDERKIFYCKLKNNPKGYQDDLKKEVNFHDNFKFDELYNEAGSVGLIKNGMDGRLKKRYSLTELGKEQIEFYLFVYDF